MESSSSNHCSSDWWEPAHLPSAFSVPYGQSEGPFLCLECCKWEICHMLCLQFSSQPKIPKSNHVADRSFQNHLSQGFHSPSQITCFREKVAIQYAVCPLGGVHPESNRWWLFKINVHFNRTIVSIAFAISTLWNYQHLMERTRLPKNKVILYFTLSQVKFDFICS